jgi:hypothetical protein
VWQTPIEMHSQATSHFVRCLLVEGEQEECLWSNTTMFLKENRPSDKSPCLSAACACDDQSVAICRCHGRCLLCIELQLKLSRYPSLNELGFQLSVALAVYQPSVRVRTIDGVSVKKIRCERIFHTGNKRSSRCFALLLLVERST